MRPLLEDYLKCVVYLYPSVAAAKQGDKDGGTGFLIAVASKFGGPPYYYAVTNSHVIARGSPVLRLTKRNGDPDPRELKKEDWTHHSSKDDLAVCPLDISADTHDFEAVYIHQIGVTKQDIYEKYLGRWINAGNDVCMCGRFKRHDGQRTNIPVARFGNISRLPKEPIKHCSEHFKEEYLQESYLVEMRSLSGFSGSPVFVYAPGGFPVQNYDTENVELVIDESAHILFLGVDWCHFNSHDDVIDRSGNKHPHGWRVESNSGMAGVIPAWKLIEFLDREEFVMQRKQADQIRADEIAAIERNSPITLDTDEPLFTKEVFVNDLTKATRRISPPDREKKET